jgi:hypothetical protein
MQLKTAINIGVILYLLNQQVQPTVLSIFSIKKYHKAFALTINETALIDQSDDRNRELRLVAALVPLALNWQP